MKRFPSVSSVSSALLAATLLAASCPPAFGAGPPAAKTTDPQKAFDEAQSLYDKGKFEEALVRFREAYDATQSPNARLLVARCLLALGRTVEAYDEIAATRAEAAEKAKSQPKYEKTRDSATADLAALEPKVGKVVITVSEPQGARVTLDGKPLASERLGAPVTVAPGKVTVVVEFPGKAPIQKDDVVQGGQTKTIVVSAEDPNGNGSRLPSVEIPKTPVQVGPSTNLGVVRIAGFVVAGLGVAGLGVFGATSVMAKNDFDSLVAECGGKRCTIAHYGETVDEGKRLDVIANAALLAGVATVAIGGVMIVIGGPKSALKSEASLRITPSGASFGMKF